MKLKGKRALVTGAGSHGIGRAIVARFAAEGADVAAHYNRQTISDGEIAQMREGGSSVFQIQADFGDPVAARRMVREAADRLGGLDILVSNAGITERMPFLEITDEGFERIIDVNLRGCFVCCQEAARIMVEAQTPGRIIIVGSVNENHVVPWQSHYCASKGGIRQLARGMALELAAYGINVNIIAPAGTLTDMNRDMHANNPDWPKQVARRYPKGRVALPEDMAGTAVFLAGDDSAFITGVSIPVDGGFSLSKSEPPPVRG